MNEHCNSPYWCNNVVITITFNINIIIIIIMIFQRSIRTNLLHCRYWILLARWRIELVLEATLTNGLSLILVVVDNSFSFEVHAHLLIYWNFESPRLDARPDAFRISSHLFDSTQ